MSRRPGGTLGVPKYIFDAIYHASLSGLERDVCLCVARWTWGHRAAENLPNGRRLGPAFIAAETQHSPTRVKQAIRRLISAGVLIRVSEARGRIAARLKVQPDPRLWQGHTPDALLASWIEAVDVAGLEEEIARYAAPRRVGGPKRRRKATRRATRSAQTAAVERPPGARALSAGKRNVPEGMLAGPSRTPHGSRQGPPQSKEVELPCGDERRCAGSSGVVALQDMALCFCCDRPVGDSELAVLVAKQLGQTWRCECWSALSEEARTQIEFVGKSYSAQVERDERVRRVLDRQVGSSVNGAYRAAGEQLVGIPTSRVATHGERTSAEQGGEPRRLRRLRTDDDQFAKASDGDG